MIDLKRLLDIVRNRTVEKLPPELIHDADPEKDKFTISVASDPMRQAHDIRMQIQFAIAYPFTDEELMNADDTEEVVEQVYLMMIDQMARELTRHGIELQIAVDKW